MFYRNCFCVIVYKILVAFNINDVLTVFWIYCMAMRKKLPEYRKSVYAFTKRVEGGGILVGLPSEYVLLFYNE